MKNQIIYNKYSIDGFPCRFFSVTCMCKYNAKIEKYCEKLNENSLDLSRGQKMRLFIYYIYLLNVDYIFCAIEKSS